MMEKKPKYQPSAQILNEVQNYYKVGPKYAQAYLEYWFESRNREFSSLQEIMQCPPPEPMWFDYALSANWRGQMMRQQLEEHLPAQHQRYLDVGSGFGGFLVAFAAIGMEVRGIEIDPIRIQLSKANCSDHGLSECVSSSSILEEDLPSKLGAFDVITCIDVIEHVLDVQKAIKNMVDLLNPGGILILEIPNKYSVNFIKQDGHFGLFGITLLERNDAIKYHQIYHKFEYDVGDYYELTYYQQQFTMQGCQTKLFEKKANIELPPLAKTIAKLWISYLTHRKNSSPHLPQELQQKIQRQFYKYLLMLAKDQLSIRDINKGKDFYFKYLQDFWTLKASKTI